MESGEGDIRAGEDQNSADRQMSNLNEDLRDASTESIRSGESDEESTEGLSEERTPTNTENVSEGDGSDRAVLQENSDSNAEDKNEGDTEGGRAESGDSSTEGDNPSSTDGGGAQQRDSASASASPESIDGEPTEGSLEEEGSTNTENVSEGDGSDRAGSQENSDSNADDRNEGGVKRSWRWIEEREIWIKEREIWIKERARWIKERARWIKERARWIKERSWRWIKSAISYILNYNRSSDTERLTSIVKELNSTNASFEVISVACVGFIRIRRGEIKDSSSHSSTDKDGVQQEDASASASTESIDGESTEGPSEERTPTNTENASKGDGSDRAGSQENSDSNADDRNDERESTSGYTSRHTPFRIKGIDILKEEERRLRGDGDKR